MADVTFGGQVDVPVSSDDVAAIVAAQNALVTAPIQIGAVTTLPAGASATATFRGTWPNLLLDLGLPKGAAGSTPQVASGVRALVLSISLGATTSVTVPITPAMPDDAYSASVSFDGAGIAAANWTLSGITRTASSVTFTVKNTGVALSAAITFLVVAVRTA